MLPPRLNLPIKMMPQPDETTCGPICLHALYHYWGREEPLQDVINRSGKLKRGGTVAVFLACDALQQGYQATIYTFNLTVFDPSWFVILLMNLIPSDRCVSTLFARVRQLNA